VAPFPATGPLEKLRRRICGQVGSRLVTCGGLAIRLVLNLKYRPADYQSAAVINLPHTRKVVAAHKQTKI